MNENLQTKLVEYLNRADAFLNDQVPDYIHQLMLFEAWNIHFWLAIFAVVLVVGVVFTFMGIKCRNCDPLLIIGPLVFILGTVGTIVNFNCSKKLELAPKVYIMKMITSECGCGC